MTQSDAQRIHRLVARSRHPFLLGVDEIIRNYLRLPAGTILPITIPHGVDFGHLQRPLDIHAINPIHLASTETSARAAAAYKVVLRFPHPWLFLVRHMAVPQGAGTLFIAPPPCRHAFEVMAEHVREGTYEQPWGVLIKDRGAAAEDFLWWEARGFRTHTAGSAQESAHFLKLRDILALYKHVASPNMSSAVVFALTLGRTASAIPDVTLESLETGDYEESLRLMAPDMSAVWRNLISDNVGVAVAEAEALLGIEFWADKEILRERLVSVIEAAAVAPLHLHPLRTGGFAYRLCVALAREGVPVHRLFPNPLKKIRYRIARRLLLHRLTIVSGSEFGHYKVVGKPTSLTFRRAFGFQLGRTAEAGQPLRRRRANLW